MDHAHRYATRSKAPARIILGLTVAALFATDLTAQRRPNDTIVQRDGTRTRGIEVTEMTLETVVFKRGNAEERVASSNVVTVLWDNPPETFKAALASAEKGDHGKAAELFMEAAKEGNRKPLQSEARFRAARSLAAAAVREIARQNSAITSLEGYLAESPEGFFAPEAHFLMGRVYRLQGKAAEAEAKMKVVESSANFGPIWPARAKFELAELASEAGRAAEARGAFLAVVSLIDSAIGQAPGLAKELESLRMRAMVGQGETFIRENKFEDALRFYRNMAGSTAPGEANPLKAAALAGEGQAIYLKAKDQPAPANLPQLREAQLLLARAGLLDSTNSNTTAKAMYYQGLILLTLGNEHERDARPRANSMFDSVVRHYQGTHWSTLARAELDKR